MKKLHFRK